MKRKWATRRSSTCCLVRPWAISERMTSRSWLACGDSAISSGTPQATQDIVAGQVDFLCNQIVNIVEHAKAGNLKVYAVTSEKRSAMLPDVPTTAEAGLPEFKLTVWYGLSAPKVTAAPLIDKLNRALAVAMDDATVVQRFAELGYDVVPPPQRSPGYFDQFMRNEVELWAKVLGGIKRPGQ